MDSAADLVAWTRLLALVGEAKPLAACEPKALRYRFLHVPARLTHAARRRRLRIPKSWPWAAAIVAVFANIAAIPDIPDHPVRARPGTRRTAARQRKPALPHAHAPNPDNDDHHARAEPTSPTS